MIHWNGMSVDSRVWIYQSNRIFSSDELEMIDRMGLNFINSWTAHGSKMKASIKVEHNAFIIIGADEKATMASGCSIDASVHFVQDLGKKMNIDFFDRMNIAILKNDHISFIQSKDITKEIENGKYSEDDITFNNLVSNKGDFIKDWMIPIKNSWVAQVL